MELNAPEFVDDAPSSFNEIDKRDDSEHCKEAGNEEMNYYRAM